MGIRSWMGPMLRLKVGGWLFYKPAVVDDLHGRVGSHFIYIYPEPSCSHRTVITEPVPE